MSNRLLSLGLPFALYACVVLTLPACGGTQKVWEPELLVEETALEPIRFKETASPGRLTLTATRKTHTRETPVERLTLIHEETYSEFDWDGFGLVFWSVTAGLATIGLSFLFAFVLFGDSDDED